MLGALLLFPGGAGAISSLVHDGFMNPVDGELYHIA